MYPNLNDSHTHQRHGPPIRRIESALHSVELKSHILARRLGERADALPAVTQPLDGSEDRLHHSQIILTLVYRRKNVSFALAAVACVSHNRECRHISPQAIAR